VSRPKHALYYGWCTQASAHFPTRQTLSIWRRSSKDIGKGQLKCDGTRAETRSPLSAKWTSPIKPAGAFVQSTGSRGVRISGSNAGYAMFRGSVKGTGYPLHSPASPSLPQPCVTVCHHISTGVYYKRTLVAVRLKHRLQTWHLGSCTGTRMGMLHTGNNVGNHLPCKSQIVYQASNSKTLWHF